MKIDVFYSDTMHTHNSTENKVICLDQQVIVILSPIERTFTDAFNLTNKGCCVMLTLHCLTHAKQMTVNDDGD